MLTKSPDGLAALFATILGKPVETLRVYGINSLKSVSPSLDSLGGGRVGRFRSTGPATFDFMVGECRVAVDLQRVGGVRFSDSLDLWTPGRPGMPSAQLVLAGGGGLDFVEPNRTKRITFALTDK